MSTPKPPVPPTVVPPEQDLGSFMVPGGIITPSSFVGPPAPAGLRPELDPVSIGPLSNGPQSTRSDDDDLLERGTQFGGSDAGTQFDDDDSILGKRVPEPVAPSDPVQRSVGAPGQPSQLQRAQPGRPDDGAASSDSGLGSAEQPQAPGAQIPTGPQASASANPQPQQASPAAMSQQDEPEEQQGLLRRIFDFIKSFLKNLFGMDDNKSAPTQTQDSGTHASQFTSLMTGTDRFQSEGLNAKPDTELREKSAAEARAGHSSTQKPTPFDTKP